MSPDDAFTLNALQLQYRELGIVLARLESARERYAPPPPASWVGAARHAYAAALDALLATLDAGIAACRSAYQQTGLAIAMLNRG